MRILIPADGSGPCRAALSFAANRASRMADPPLAQIVAAEPSIPAGGVGTMAELAAVQNAYLADGRRVIESMMRDAGGLSVTAEVRCGRPGKVIAEAADDYGADLIAMGTRGRSSAKQLFLGSVSRDVLASAKQPVLLLREKPRDNPESLPILIAADGSSYGSVAAAFVAQHRDFFGPNPEAEVICVLPDMKEHLARNHSRGMEEFIEKTRARWEEEADGLWQDAVQVPLEILEHAGIRAQAVKRFGNPADEIAKRARERGGIVIMGSHGRGRLLAAVMGSTAAKLCTQADFPVLIVRGEQPA